MTITRTYPTANHGKLQRCPINPKRVLDEGVATLTALTISGPRTILLRNGRMPDGLWRKHRAAGKSRRFRIVCQTEELTTTQSIF